jgi:glycosyltransferase involved in cell wall biosynthesis
MTTIISKEPATELASAVVSVVMVTYNHAPYIEAAITSILVQNFPGTLELIIGEDCSTDQTGSIVRRFHERYPGKIKLVTSANNVGADANFRRCILSCTGEFIALCEGDDFWNDPEKLSKQIRIMLSNPEVGAVHSDFSHTIFLEKKWRTLEAFRRRHRQHVACGRILDKLIINNFIQTCTLCMRAQIAKDYFSLPLPLESYAVGDWPLCIFASEKKEIAYIDESLATYRRTPGSILNQGYNNDMARSEACMSMISDFCKFYGLPENLETQSHAALLKQALFFSLLAGNTERFEFYWQCIYDKDPGYTDQFRPKLAKIIVRHPRLHRIYLWYRSMSNYLRLHYLYQ